MGSQTRARQRTDMNLHCFVSFFLLVIAVNGAPKAKPDPKGKPQMALIFNGHNGRGMFPGMGGMGPGMGGMGLGMGCGMYGLGNAYGGYGFGNAYEDMDMVLRVTN